MTLALLGLLACRPDKGGETGARPDPWTETGQADSDLPHSGDTDSAAPGEVLRITEAMSDNHSALEDGAGDTPDWVELYNPGPDPVALAGWTLSDGSEDPYTFGEESILGGAFLVVYASGQGADGPAGERHAPYKLDADGDALTLRRPDGSVADAVTLPALPEDVSWGIQQPVRSETVLGDGSAARLSAEALDGWEAPAFDDDAWEAVTLPVGFDRSASTAEPENAALGKPTTQSTDGYGYTGAQAVDGEPSTFSHTGDGDDAPWLEIDLEQDYPVSEITLMNRADCCAERLYNVVVTLLDADGSTVWTSETVNPVAEGEVPTSPGAIVSLPVDPPVVARTAHLAKTAVTSYSSSWLSFAEVVVTGELAAPYGGVISTEIDTAPAYLRAAFTAEGPPTSATLSVAWDDGFGAVLNGSAVAEDQLGETLATGEHDGSAAEDYAVDPRLIVAGDNLLALTVQNVRADDDDLLLRPTLRLDWITEGETAYFGEPTPGAPNGEGVEGFVAEPTVDPPRGFYEATFTATISTTTAGATLIYTLDGSAPGLDNGVVVPPADDATPPAVEIEVSATTLVRAVAVRDGWWDSEVATHTLLFLGDVLHQPAAPSGWPTVWDGVSEAPYTADYEMDPEIVDPDPEAMVEALQSIPTLSIVTDLDDLFGPDGLYENSAERGAEWERGVSVEYILPDGSTGFQADCGLRVHGYGWRYHSSTLKHSFRLEFSRDYGERKLEYPLFADSEVDRFDSVVLRAGGSKTWLDFRDPAQAQYLHDSFARDTARDMGKLDGHATYVHLYLNGLYWGLYNPVERPEAGFGEEYLGGDDDEYDAINRRTVTNEAVDGTLEAYNELLARAEGDLSTDAGLAAVEEMLDLDDLIDYMLIHQYTVNRDGPCCFSHNNMRGLRRRVDGEQFRFFVWDMEYSLWDATDDTNVDIDVDGAISHVYAQLRDNATFRARYAERARLHLTDGGALTPEAAAARYQARADEIYAALLAESARWGDTYRSTPYTRDVEWQAEYDRLMDEYFPYRTDQMIDQLTAAGLY